MDAFSASLMADKREIIFAPTVYKFQTFAQMAEEFKLNERDVVLTNEFIYTPFMKDLGLIPAVGGHGDGGFLLLLPTGSTEQESQQQAGEQNLFHGGTPFSLGEGLNTGQFFQRGNAVFQGILRTGKADLLAV